MTSVRRFSPVATASIIVMAASVMWLGSHAVDGLFGGSMDAWAERASSSAASGPVAKLTRELLDSDDQKARLSAAVALARLADPRSFDALIEALDDEHRSVRAVAATALGKIGDRRALPALREALRDRRSVVRKHARKAIEALEASGGKSAFQVSHRPGQAGFGQNGRAVARPQVHVVLGSATDESGAESGARSGAASGKRSKRSVRKQRANDMKRLFNSALASNPDVTTSARLARKLGIERYSLDASIIRMTERRRGSYMEINCEIRVTISDRRGKMLSFLTGSARVQVPRSSFDESKRPQIQHEAIESVVASMQDDILSYLASLRPQG